MAQIFIDVSLLKFKQISIYLLDIMKLPLIKLSGIYKSKLCEENQFKFLNHRQH